MLWLLVGQDCSLVGHLTCSEGNGGNEGFLYLKLEEGKASEHVPPSWAGIAYHMKHI